MSDFIQKLADKAKKSVPYGLTPDKWIEVYNEKFAELIIRECGKSCTLQGDEDDMFRKFGIKHLGVE